MSASQLMTVCPTAAGDEPLISPLLWRNIIGQGVFQLGIMFSLVQVLPPPFSALNHVPASLP